MARLGNLIKNLFVKKQDIDEENVRELRIAFRARYHQFKLLLNANNRALEIMAEIEEALKGYRPFGMTFVLSRCTGVSTSVWQIVKNLDELASGKHEELYERFKTIQKMINPFMQRKRSLREGPLAIPIEKVDKNMADLVGNKIANLGEIKNRIGLKVPNGFVITSTGYQRFMEHNDLQSEIERKIQSMDTEHLDQLFNLSTDLQQMVIQSPLPEELESAILENYNLLQEREGEGITVALRSSALGEDIAGTSFAGQYRSELNVSGDHILDTYREIVASKYGLSAMTYRFNRGIRDEAVAMCVGCLPMVDALAGGVVYSRNPVNLREEAVIINSVWGLPKPIVDGSISTDLFVISRKEPMEIIRKEIAVKEQKFVCYPDEGVCRLDMTDEEAKQSSLTDDEALVIARLAMKLEEYYGIPQDVEWAIDTNRSIIVLQCRPLQQKDVPRLSDDETRDQGSSETIILSGGITASPGVAAGSVFLLQRDADTLRFPENGILVAAQALPRWAALMGRTSAVITEKGGITGHLANVAREFDVPALLGLDGVMDVLKNDQVVTVDADGRKVYEGRIDALLDREESGKNLMLGSPVFEALEGASKNIIPLNLLDPDASSFKPKYCKTFHDITRFCHEKAVHEMFQFGKEHHFPERSSKQLVYDIPMQWWILNLDDGFKEEVDGKYVQLENILSIPMRALWEGITAFPWEGPPPVDGKGFMSVIFEATRNTSLVPSVRSSYADRNYFMISKNFCSLSSRLGFHFSIVEALVSERMSENYISFQFKGGAADDQRRQRRILFIANLLEEYGFRVEARKDHLIARLENYEKAFMENRLKILGYLTIHTRQLDMIMSNESRVNYYRAKINQDIQTLFATVQNGQ
ncbi:PEP/pyruvate-binding domain-containing protein [Thermodesulfobacteriota bacterium]